MKRKWAVLMSCALTLALPAMAEEAVEATDAPTEVMEAAAYEGEWTTISGDAGEGMDICLPSGWQQMELSDEDVANGMFYGATDETGEWGFTVSYAESEEPVDVDAVTAELNADDEGAVVVNVGGRDCIRYTDEELDAIVLVVPDDGGMSVFTFTPASDAEFSALAEDMIGSIRIHAVVEDMEETAVEEAEESGTDE